MSEENKEDLFLNREAVLEELRLKYFELAQKENYPYTPEITNALDEIQIIITNSLNEEKV